MKRYNKTNKFINNTEEYSSFFEERQMNPPAQVGTFKINEDMTSNISSLNYVFHKYRVGERLYNISNKYYGDPSYWWLILLTNKLENHFQLYDGIPLKIYLPLQSVLGAVE